MNLDYLSQSVANVERDLGVMLLTSEDCKQDVIEYPYMHGDDVRYVSHVVSYINAEAYGFIFNHPNGATIRGRFETPVTVCTAVMNKYGCETSFYNNMQNVAKALLEKLGNIAELDDIKAIAGA